MAKCSATTKAGKPCKAAPLKDRDHCRAHDRMRPDEDRFGSPAWSARAGASEKPRIPRPTEVARRLVEDNIAAVLRPYWRSLGYEVIQTGDGLAVQPLAGGGSKVSASFRGEITLSDIEDLSAQIDAAERLQDRTFGKPRQVQEITGAEGGPIEHALDLRSLSDEELDEYERLIDRAQSRSRPG